MRMNIENALSSDNLFSGTESDFRVFYFENI